MSASIVSALRTIPPPLGLESEDIPLIEPFFTATEVKKDGYIFKEGDDSNELFVVCSGRVAVKQAGFLLAEFAPGQSIGEIGMLEGRKRRADGIAAEDTTVLILSRDRLFSKDFPPLLSSKIFLYLGKRMTSLLGGTDVYRHMDVLIVQDGGCSPGYNAVTAYLAEYFSVAGIRAYVANQGFRSIVSGQSTDFSLLIHNEHTFKAVNLVPSVVYVGQLRDQRGASFRSERYPEFKEQKNQQRAADVIVERNVKILVCIGGNGTFAGSRALSKLLPSNIQVFFIPSTIDRDVGGTECIGQHTAIEMGSEKLRCYKADARTHHRCYIIEMMGRDGGFHCLYSCLGAGGHLAVMPGSHIDFEKVAQSVMDRSHTVIAVAEGFGREERAQTGSTASASEYFLKKLMETGRIDSSKRKIIAEPFSRDIRGAATNNLDMVLSQKMAKEVVALALAGKTCAMPTVNGAEIGFLPFDKITTDNSVDPKECALANRLDVEAQLNSIKSQ